MNKIFTLVLGATIFVTNPTFAMDPTFEMEELTIDGKITKQQLEKLKQCTRLTSLDLGGTDLSNQDLFYISQLTKLRTLSLIWNPKLTDDCVPHLQSLTNLETLYIGSCLNTGLAPKITPDGYEQLLSHLPNLEYFQVDYVAPELYNSWPKVKFYF